MISFAVGLSLTGKIAFANSFAVFSTGRPFDQIRQGVAIGKMNVKIIGSSAGLSDFGDGATHQSVEDIAIMRAIPNMTVISPCDAIETKKSSGLPRNTMARFISGSAGTMFPIFSRKTPGLLSVNRLFYAKAKT